MFGEFEETNDCNKVSRCRPEADEEKLCTRINDSLSISTNQENSIPIEENYDLSLQDRITNCIARKKEIIVKTQQRNEPDFTFEERKEILSELLEENPCKFLYRFGKYLEREHLLYFNDFPGPEIQFYVQETQKLLNDSTKRAKLKNRRFGAFCKMESGSGSYFSEDEMKKREPLLYQELVEKNLTDEEITQRNSGNVTKEINSFSDLLFEQMERNGTRTLRQVQEEEEDCCEEDDDSESEYEEPCPPDEREKELLRGEFKTAICAEFLAGADQQFDYSHVDDCEENDLLDWMARDEEEMYFDQEEPSTLQEGDCDVGSLDDMGDKSTVNESHLEHMDDGS